MQTMVQAPALDAMRPWSSSARKQSPGTCASSCHVQQSPFASFVAGIVLKAVARASRSDGTRAALQHTQSFPTVEAVPEAAAREEVGMQRS